MDNYFIIEEPCLDYFTEKVSQTLEYCLFGNIGAQLAASFLLKFAIFAKFFKQPESLCCSGANQILDFFSCNTAVFPCVLKNE